MEIQSTHKKTSIRANIVTCNFITPVYIIQIL